MFEVPAVLKIGYFEIVVPRKEGLWEEATSSAFLENKLGSAGEEMFDVVFGKAISLVALVMMICEESIGPSGIARRSIVSPESVIRPVLSSGLVRGEDSLASVVGDVTFAGWVWLAPWPTCGNTSVTLGAGTLSPTFSICRYK